MVVAYLLCHVYSALMEAFKLEFGKHAGATLGQVAKIDPTYVIWLSGTATKYTFSQAFQEVKRDHPDAIEARRENM